MCGARGVLASTAATLAGVLHKRHWSPPVAHGRRARRSHGPAGIVLEGLEEWEIQPDEIVLGPRIGIGRWGRRAARRHVASVPAGRCSAHACQDRAALPPSWPAPPTTRRPPRSFGEVFRGIWRQTDVAVKRLLDQEVSPQVRRRAHSSVLLLDPDTCLPACLSRGGPAAAGLASEAWPSTSPRPLRDPTRPERAPVPPLPPCRCWRSSGRRYRS